MNHDKSITVSFSGHRSFKIAAPQRTLFDGECGSGDDIDTLLRHAIGELYDRGYRVFLCGMAEGFDMAAATAVVDMRRDRPDIRLVAVIPFEGQQRTFSAGNRERYAALLGSADHRVVTSPCYRPESYHLRNDYLVANSSALVCFYNGSKGGTDYTVRHALRRGLRVINLCRTH